MDFLTSIFLSYITIYSFSIIYNLLVNNHESSRVLATFNNISLWIVALLFYLIYKNNKINIQILHKIIFVNYIILIFFYIVCLFMYHVLNMSNFSILGQSLFNLTWFDNTIKMRFTGFFDYSNLVIMYYFLFYPIFLKVCFNLKNIILKVVLLVLSFSVVISTLSRSGYIILILAFLISICVIYMNKNNKILVFALSFIGLTIVIIILVYTNMTNLILSEIKELIGSREGSTETRSLILNDSINIVLNDSLLIGMGVKDSSPYDQLPYGSHSTFVGFFYKAGLMGLILGTLLILWNNLKLLFVTFERPLIIKVTSVFYLLMTAMLFVEDIDGSNWLLIFYFTLAGIYLNNENWRSET
ncbi:O-antigen polymerase [Metabacillus sp. 84]|uniref:O-antigen polymerase n=1 Tax=Metabacillus sp. 84 TaxID=3404705 RepID=UPI003CEC390A